VAASVVVSAVAREPDGDGGSRCGLEKGPFRRAWGLVASPPPPPPPPSTAAGPFPRESFPRAARRRGVPPPMCPFFVCLPPFPFSSGVEAFEGISSFALSEAARDGLLRLGAGEVARGTNGNKRLARPRSSMDFRGAPGREKNGAEAAEREEDHSREEEEGETKEEEAAVLAVGNGGVSGRKALGTTALACCNASPSMTHAEEAEAAGRPAAPGRVGVLDVSGECGPLPGRRGEEAAPLPREAIARLGGGGEPTLPEEGGGGSGRGGIASEESEMEALGREEDEEADDEKGKWFGSIFWPLPFRRCVSLSFSNRWVSVGIVVAVGLVGNVLPLVGSGRSSECNTAMGEGARWSPLLPTVMDAFDRWFADAPSGVAEVARPVPELPPPSPPRFPSGPLPM